MKEHKGSYYYYRVHKCHCDGCVAAYQTKLQARYIKDKQTRAAEPKPEREIPPHGTTRRYQSKTNPCHCPECREANSTYQRERKGHKKRVPKQLGRPATQDLKATAKPLKIVGVPRTPTKAVPAPTFEHTPVVDCGERMGGEHYCRRLWPCAIHPDQSDQDSLQLSTPGHTIL